MMNRDQSAVERKPEPTDSLSDAVQALLSPIVVSCFKMQHPLTRDQGKSPVM